MKTSTSSSSSSSYAESITILPQIQKPKPLIKRVRKIQNKNKKSDKKIENENDKNVTNPSSVLGRRSSIYRGVTRHRWTGRFEAHLWDKSSWNNIQNKKGRQVYLGAYDSEEHAAHTYDLAALKYWGPETTLNFPIETYEKQLEEMEKVSKEEYLASLRRRSSGFSRGVSKFRGVARHHHNGRWEARIGRVHGNKYLYLGTYNTQEEAAAAYDLAAIEYRGANAVTNFDISNYMDQLKAKNIIIPSLEQPENQQTSLTNPNPNLSLQSPIPKSETQNPGPQMLETYPNFSPSILDYPSESQNHHNWNFLVDTPLPLPNLPLEKPEKFPDFMLEDFAFEDNIDFIFDDIEVSLSQNICGNISGGGNMNQENYFSSSSPSSTTTSIFSNYSG